MIDIKENNSFVLNCGGTLLNFAEPKVMGILNITPDSFYDGGRYNSETAILKKVEKMLSDGADIIDIGAVSTKPSAEDVTPEIEKERLLPILKLIKKTFSESIVSVDTFRSSIAEMAINEGAVFINDIYAGVVDKNIFEIAARNNIPIAMMHIQGTPKTMQLNPTYSNVITEVFDYFVERIDVAKSYGVKDILVDVGFGFGKTLEHNYTILKQLDFFKLLGYPLLVGVSRKSMIYKLLENTPQEALNGTTVLHTIALQNGANILRVHDVKEAKECIKIVEMLKKN
ncbi:MAG TPA: dihydropteroate synthase [Chitinophagales bacterium]|nr:dihydropteroate synthase [Chitinophagales bacterium]HNB38262.1 dihydropteroate synthase [Chitinophagales bacterium]HNE87245.1 dihydropteroate synthase [Chitinophagales bacterium]HNJ60401.1 dihydropteroate synthase [Chitinophagales bacterium]HNM67432.1 dihydropteroate synthase [Chitinophagales bacterium]